MPHIFIPFIHLLFSNFHLKLSIFYTYLIFPIILDTSPENFSKLTPNNLHIFSKLLLLFPISATTIITPLYFIPILLFLSPFTLYPFFLPLNVSQLYLSLLNYLVKIYKNLLGLLE
jgi:hypothetical protein